MKTVTASAIEADFSFFLQQVENGEEVTITKNGYPIARLLPARTTEREQRRQAVQRIREFSESNLLGGLDWKELRDVGRR